MKKKRNHLKNNQVKLQGLESSSEVAECLMVLCPPPTSLLHLCNINLPDDEAVCCAFVITVTQTSPAPDVQDFTPS